MRLYPTLLCCYTVLLLLGKQDKSEIWDSNTITPLCCHTILLLLGKQDNSEIWDSNTITPGTPFMHRLAVALQYYVHRKLNDDPGWRGLKVGGWAAASGWPQGGWVECC